MDFPMEGPLLKSLQKFFQNAESLHSETHDAIKDLKPHLNTLQNQTEQFTMCKHVDITRTALAQFSDVKPLILNKIRINIEECILEFHKALLKIKGSQMKVTKQHSSTLSTYNTLSEDCDLTVLTTGSPTCPCVSDMLQWMDDVESAFYEDVIAKETSLRRLNFEDDESVETMVKVWSDTGQLTERLKNVLFYLQYFTEEKI